MTTTLKKNPGLTFDIVEGAGAQTAKRTKWELQREKTRLRGAEVVLIAEDYVCTEWELPEQDPRLAELFSALNAQYFDNLLPAIPVLRGIPRDAFQWDEQNGLTRLFGWGVGPDFCVEMHIYLSDLLFQYPFESEQYRWELITDTLIHEMAHVAVHLDALGEDAIPDEGHGQRFTDECNRLGLLILGPRVKPLEESQGCECECGSDLWPNRFLKEKYGPVLDPSTIEKFATPQRAAA